MCVEFFNVSLSSRRWFMLCLVYISYLVSVLVLSRVEAGSNTFTVAMRDVGGDEEGSPESETVKYGLQSHGTRTRE
jgi:hypothetical protein